MRLLLNADRHFGLAGQRERLLCQRERFANLGRTGSRRFQGQEFAQINGHFGGLFVWFGLISEPDRSTCSGLNNVRILPASMQDLCVIAAL